MKKFTRIASALFLTVQAVSATPRSVLTDEQQNEQAKEDTPCFGFL